MADINVFVFEGAGDSFPNYSTLEGALNDNEQDLTAVSGILHVIISGAWASPDTTVVLVENYVTSADYYLNIYTDSTARHTGKWDDTKYRLVAGPAGTNIRCDIPYTRMDGLQVEMTYTGGSSRYGIQFTTTADFSIVSSNIIRLTTAHTGNVAAAYMQGEGLQFYNNIIYDFISTATDAGIRGQPSPAEAVRVYNNTIVNCAVGMDCPNLGRFDAQNNLLEGCTAQTSANDFHADTDYNTTDGSSFEYTQGSPANDIVDATITFEGAEDFHLASQQHNDGFDHSAVFTDDIDGDIRSSWNRGADEFVAAAAGATSFHIQHIW